MEYVTRGLKERKKQEEERTLLTTAINEASDKISNLTLKKSELALEQDKIEAEVGPIKYIAELIYGENAKDHFDKAVRWVIIVLIFVFDPLAVLLLIAANISLRSRKVAKEEDKAKIQKDYQKEATNAKTRAKRVRDREKVYKDILKKIGTGELKSKDYDKMKKLGLNPDEIRIKLNQIMDLS
jgi:ABC-type protease/lipase transport system fused ATPase/permease subunit